MRRLTFYFFILVSFKLQAQELFFSPPSDFQNLPSLETYSILQDSKGFIWITTDAGICRYDGNRLTVFTLKDGLPESVVFKVYEGDKGRVWFSTLSGYFFYYEEGKFHSIDANERLKKICRSAFINTFFIGDRDTLFLTTGGGSSAGGVRAVIKIPPENNYSSIFVDSIRFLSCSRFFMTNTRHPLEFLMGAGGTPDKKESKWITVGYNTETFHLFFRSEDLNLSSGRIGIIDKDANLYILIGRQLITVTKSGILKDKYNFDNVVYSCYLDADNDLWVCTGKGGYLFKDSDLKKAPIPFLSNLALSSVFIDREGTVWVTTQEKGIFKSMNKEVLFLDTQENNPMHFQKSKHQLQITYTSGQLLTLFKNDSVFWDNRLQAIVPPDKKLISSFISDDFYYLQMSGKFSIWNRKRNVSVRNVSSLNVKEMLSIGKDSLVFVSHPCIATIYNKKDSIIYGPFPIQSALQLKNKKILFSSRNNSGIYEFVNNKFIPYLSHLPQLKTRINGMIEDEKGNLWFATNEYGLYCYDHHNQLHHFTTSNGLASDKINTLTIDGNEQLWLGSYNGLTKVSYSNDLLQFQAVNFGKSHGIPNLQIEKIIAFDGKIVCIAKNVCFFFKEKQLKKNTIPPLNYIQSVSINDEGYPVNDTVILSYDKNNLHILTSLLSYKNPEQKQFLYKLMGFNEEWRVSTTGDIQYTNLPHGKYNFVVYGLNNDNLKSDRPATFTFTIKRPFWLTWWFIALEIILFCIIFLFFFRFWKGRIQKKAHDKALINQKIAEFKMTALRSQMNPHFVFNAISSIQHYILKQDTFKSYNYLAKFSLLIRTILDNSKEEYIALSQEISTLQLYIELEQIRFKQPFQFILDVDEDLEMDTYIPTMLIQPYVENSIWHGLMPKKTNCTLQVSLKKKDTHIFVTIQDNGVGRNYVAKKSSLHASKGMSITEQRIKELETTNEKKFSVTIIDLTDEKGDAAGTEVQIIIPFDL